jgi:ribose transport system permease protein
MSAATSDRPGFGRRLADLGRTLVSPRGAVFLLLIVLLVAITLLNPSFAEPGQLIRFVQRVAPVAIVAIGQYFVIVGGEFDLSMGSVVTAQVVIAGNLIGQDDAKALPVFAFMVAFGAFIGLVNGLIVSFLKVPSFIVTLGMMLALLGATLYWTGGAATGNPADSFREIGRGGIRDLPVVEVLPWSVVIFVVVLLVAVWFAKRPFGRTIIALGDNPTTARFSGTRSWWVKTSTFIVSSLSATLAGVLLVGYAGVHPSVGRGYEFTAITAVVLGGVVLGGGRGTVLAAMAGALTVEALFTLFNQLSLPSTIRPTAQGLIIIAAVAWAARERRRPFLEPTTQS